MSLPLLLVLEERSTRPHCCCTVAVGATIRAEVEVGSNGALPSQSGGAPVYVDALVRPWSCRRCTPPTLLPLLPSAPPLLLPLFPFASSTATVETRYTALKKGHRVRRK